MSLLNNSTLSIDPEYQRKVVWPPKRMTGLIDSLMDDRYIPPLIFNRISTSRNLNCVDGKQRISSVKAFVDGSIPCTDRNKRKWYFRSPEDQPETHRKSILPEHVKQNFFSKKLYYCKVSNLSAAQEEDLFSTIQLADPLSVAEKFRAKRSRWHDLAKLFETDFKEVLSLSTTKRAKDFQNILQCFAQILEVQSKGNDDLSAFQSKALHKFVQDESKLTPATRSHFAKVFTTFKEIAEKDPQTFKNNGYSRSKNFAAIEVVAVAVFISRCGDYMSHEALLGGIRAMREAARRELDDLMTNTHTWTFFWKFIRSIGSQTQTTDDPVEDDDMPLAVSDGAQQEVLPAGPEESDNAKSVHGQKRSLIVKLRLKRKALSDTERAPLPQKRQRMLKDPAPPSNDAGEEADNDSSASDVAPPHRRSQVNRPATPRAPVERPPGIMPGTRTPRRRRARDKKPATAAGGTAPPSDDSGELNSQSNSSGEPPPKVTPVDKPATMTPRNSVLGIAARFNNADAGDDSDGTSSGYSTHSEPRGGPLRRRPHIRNSSRHSTVPNTTSPDPISGVDGTVEVEPRARNSVLSADPLQGDGDTRRPELSIGSQAPSGLRPTSDGGKRQPEPGHSTMKNTAAQGNGDHPSACQAGESADTQRPKELMLAQPASQPVGRQPSSEARPSTELPPTQFLGQHENVPATVDGRRPSTDNETRSYTIDRSSTEFGMSMDLEDDFKPTIERKPITFPKIETGARELAEKRRRAREERERLAARNG